MAAPLRPRSTAALARTLPMVIVLTAIGAAWRGAPGAVAAFSLWLAWRWIGVPEVVCRDQRRGMRRAKEGDHAGAAEAFAASERVWAGRRWLDRNRAWLLGIASPWSLWSLARFNRAVSLGRTGRGAEAADLLDELLARTPGMGEARVLRDFLRAETAPAPDWDDLRRELGDRPLFASSQESTPGKRDPGGSD